MPFYVTRGELPPKKHTQFYKADQTSLYREHLVSTRGFAAISSTKYHHGAPTQVTGYEELAPLPDPSWPEAPLACRHFRTDTQLQPGNFLSARTLYLHNQDVAIHTAIVTEQTDMLYRNAFAHELIFIHHGHGRMRCEYGVLDFSEGDFLIIPKGTTYQMTFDDMSTVKLYIVESPTPIEIPLKYRNEYGQLLEHAPYSERDFKAPDFSPPLLDDQPTDITIKANRRLFRYTYAHHPFDLVGWDGYLYPFIFNIEDYLPIVGKTHQPPPVHSVFVSRNVEIYSFTPRLFDFHPRAIPVPYFHSNVDCDEVIYYVSGNFMSRKGIGEGSVTLHPMGIPHGPQPGLIEKSLGKTATDEYAVMVDTYAPLTLTTHLRKAEVKDYYRSWLENG
jgi:homogentisate 1,2-dioxygenase